MRGRMIEELGKRETNAVESCPVEIAENNSLLRFLLYRLHQAHLRAEILPALAVVNDSVDPRPELRVHRFTEFFLPPHIEGQIGVEM